MWCQRRILILPLVAQYAFRFLYFHHGLSTLAFLLFSFNIYNNYVLFFPAFVAVGLA
jgi:hypothetical protein